MKRTIFVFCLLAGGLLVGAGVPSQPAGAVDRTAQTGYTCQIQQGNGSTPIDTEPMTLGITLGLPASVRPGESIAMRGTLRLAFPAELSKAANGLFTTADGYSDTMSLQVGGKVFRADRWQTPQIPIGDPIVVSAPISFPALTVPNDPGGSLDIVMARNNVLANPYFSSPSPVAFTATASASGPAGTFTFNLACALTSGKPAVLARIPIEAPSAGQRAASAPRGTARSAPQPARAPSAGAQAPGAAAPGVQAPGAARSAPSAAETAPHADGRLPSAASGASPGAQQSLAALPSVSPADTDDGVYVPVGVLLGVGSLVVVVALGYGAWAHYRLRMLQQMLDDR